MDSCVEAVPGWTVEFCIGLLHCIEFGMGVERRNRAHIGSKVHVLPRFWSYWRTRVISLAWCGSGVYCQLAA